MGQIHAWHQQDFSSVICLCHHCHDCKVVHQKISPGFYFFTMARMMEAAFSDALPPACKS
jgi:hypothetical protein